MTDTEKVKFIANLVKSEINKHFIENKIFSTWPLTEDEIKADRVEIPNLLKTLLYTLLSSLAASARVKRLINSIGQDIIYNSSNGRIKTIKHIQLALVTKRKTGSKFLINCLNRLGHCTSYDQVSIIETSFAEAQAVLRNQRSFVPNNVQPSRFVTFVYDNCDHNPETSSGVSMHCTNGILIQRRVNTADNSEFIINIPTVCNQGQKRRSFKPILSEVQPYYPPKERNNPEIVRETEIHSNLIVQTVSKKAELLWVLSRYKSMQEDVKQGIPSWTGFYYEVMPRTTNEPHSVYYLPTINQSPTRFDTVQEVLFQVKEKSEALGLRSTDLVLDHAIYAKALEVMTNPALSFLYKYINLRMGGFHACGIFIAVIAKRFGSAGLKDLMIEANLIGPSSVESALKGSYYSTALLIGGLFQYGKTI